MKVHVDLGLDYRAKRRRAYERELPLADFVDAFAKAQDGNDADLKTYLARRRAIKARFPKG